MKCTVCKHPDLHAIDQALLARSHTLEALSRQFGPSISALHRHKNHLQEKISQARRQLDHNLRLGLFFKLNRVLERTEAASAKAEANDNIDQVLKAARVSNRIIRDLGKMETSWDGLTAYRVLASPQWQNQDSLLPTEPAFLAAGHQALAQALFHPCPDPSPGRDLADDDEADDERDPQGGDSQSAAPPAMSCENLLSGLGLRSPVPGLSPALARLHPDLLESLTLTLAPPPPAPPAPTKREKARNHREISRPSKQISS